MDSTNRIQYLKNRWKNRWKTPLPLSTKAAEILEEIKAEDKDLGGEAFGEILQPDSVRIKEAFQTEDESEENTQEISPYMRRMEQEAAHAERMRERELMAL